MDKLRGFVELVSRYADRLDLVSPADLGQVRSRHVDDSLRAAAAVAAAPGGPAVDVGSGAGFPGVPLAIVDPSRAWTLLEPRRRRAAFLEEVVRALDLANVVVAAVTAEEAASGSMAAGFVVATARALAPPPAALAIIRPLVAPGGDIILFVGPHATLPNAVEVEPGLLKVEVTEG